MGDVGVGLVGDEDLVAEPLSGVEDGELRAGMRSFPPCDHPGPVRPPMFDQAGELENPGAVPGRAVGLDRGPPVFFLGQTQGVTDPLIDTQADREPHAAIATALDEVMGRASRVGAHQHLDRARGDRELGEGAFKHFEMISGVVRTGPSGTQQPGERFAALIEIRDDRREPEPALVGRGRVLLLGMRVEECPIDVDDDLVRRRPRGPRPSTRFGARHRDVAQPLGVDRVEHPEHRRVRSDRSEQLGLVAQHRDVRQTVATVRE